MCVREDIEWQPKWENTEKGIFILFIREYSERGSHWRFFWGSNFNYELENGLKL